VRDLGTYKRCAKPRRAHVGTIDLPVGPPGDAESILEVDRHFTPTAVHMETPKHVYVQLDDEAGNPDGARREVFDSRD
jgi:hypothetical protein